MNVALLAGIALQALAGADAARLGPTPVADSMRVRRDARDEQASFEFRRVALLPYRNDPGNECEERIGRMCYSWGGRDAPKPPEEPASIAEARSALLRHLEDAADRLPGDEWVAGQFVRYLLEADRTDDAQRFARSRCSAERWWCNALAGWAAHEGERFAEAESAFAVALALMPAKDRCRWEDISSVLEPSVSSRYRRLDCEQKRAEQARVLWLARPLFSREGNDLLTEHYSRLTLERVLRDSRNPYGIPWGDDLRELVVRYGWAHAWTRRFPTSAYASRATVSGQERGLALQFFPDRATIDEPSRMSDSSWMLEARQARSRYAPRWADVLQTPPHQLARFRRGDSVVVVATYDVTADTLFGHVVSAALALAPARPGSTAVVRATGGRSGRLVALAARENAELASLEVLDRPRRAAARARSALSDDPGEPSLSDLLLLDPVAAAEGVDSLARAVSAALTSSVVRAGARVGVYWEIYSLSERDSLGDISLTLSRERGGTFRRAAEAMRLVARPLPVILEWRDRTPRGARVVGRSVIIDLVGVPAGRYMLELDVKSGGRELRAARAITVTP